MQYQGFVFIASGIRMAEASGSKRHSGATIIYEAYKWDNVWDYESYDHARKQGKLSASPPAERSI